MATLLAVKFGSVDAIAKGSEEELSSVEGIGPIVASSIREFFAEKHNREVIEKLKKAWRQFPAYQISAGPKPLAGKSFVLTGGLEKYSRDQAKKLLQNLGANVVSSVSKKTDYVVVGTDPGSKYDQAMKLKIPILTEDNFMKMIGEK